MPGASGAADLVINGGFDTDIFGWRRQITTVDRLEWSSEDAARSSRSGSALLTRTLDHTGGSISALVQCVPVEAGRSHRLEAKAFIPTGQSAETVAAARLSWYSSEECSDGAFIEVSGSVSTTDAGSWVLLEAGEAIAPPAARGALIQLSVYGPAGSEHTARFDDVILDASDGTVTCSRTPTSLCLADNRFQVTLAWRTLAGASGLGQAVQLTADSGYFWIFDEANVEVVVKVLDACSFNDRFWVFAAGLTDVEAEITVTDTELEASTTYVNPLGTAFEAVQDTDAFVGCP